MVEIPRSEVQAGQGHAKDRLSHRDKLHNGTSPAAILCKIARFLGEPS